MAVRNVLLDTSFIVVQEKPALARRSILEFLATLPPGPLLFKTPEEANRYIQEEHDSWER